MKLILLTIFISTGLLNAADIDTNDYINKLLPDTSLVRLIHNKEPRATRWWSFDSSKRQTCDEVESTLKQLFEDLEHYEKIGKLETYEQVIDLFGCSVKYDFRRHFCVKLNSKVTLLFDNEDLLREELQIMDTALSPAWARAETVDQAYWAKCKAESEAWQKKLAEERIQKAAATRTAILAQYK